MSSPTDDCEQQTIESRLERLETQSATLLRQNRRLKLVLLGVVLLCGTGILMGGRNLEVAKTVEAEKFILRDSEGRQRATINTTNDNVMFALYDSNGKQRIMVAVSAKGEPEVRLKDQGGATRMHLSLNERGDSMVLMGDGKEAAHAVWLGYESGDETPRLRLKKGSGAYHAQVTREGPLTTFEDNDGTKRLHVGVLTAGPGISLSDSKGKNRAALAVFEKGKSLNSSSRG